MDVLRARAYLDLLLPAGRDSRPGQDGAAVPRAWGGFAGRVTLTVPLATLAGLASRPGELAGLGPVDPWLARPWQRRRRQPEDDVVRHRDRRAGARRRPRLRPARTQAASEAGRTESRDGPGFAFTATAKPGTWRLRVPRSRAGPAGQVRSDRPPSGAITGSRPRAMIPGSS